MDANPSPGNAVAATLKAIWQRNLPETRARLSLLQRTAQTLSTTRTIEPSDREEATAVAHKLAGSLGMFGFTEATNAARAIEVELTHAGLPQPERLQQQVDHLAAELQPHLD